MEISKGMQIAIDALDKKFGDDWPTRIDTGQLNMMSTSHCLLGQLAYLRAGQWSDTVEQMVGWDTSSEDTPTTYFAGHDEEWLEYIHEYTTAHEQPTIENAKEQNQ
jgi:hypothetical protein